MHVVSYAIITENDKHLEIVILALCQSYRVALQKQHKAAGCFTQFHTHILHWQLFQAAFHL